jgi:hypothetical protein
MKLLGGLCEEILAAPKMPEASAKIMTCINDLIDTCAEELRQLKERHKQYINKHVCSYRVYETLRQKLLNAESLNAGEATGDAMAKMLKEIEQPTAIGNPYCLPVPEAEKHMAEVKQSIADIKMNIETIWKPSNEFKNCLIIASDLSAISPTATSVSFISCNSKEWPKIGQRLAGMSHLKTLVMKSCDSEDSFCASICGSKSLTNLCIENCRVSN